VGALSTRLLRDKPDHPPNPTNIRDYPLRSSAGASVYRESRPLRWVTVMGYYLPLHVDRFVDRRAGLSQRSERYQCGDPWHLCS
jgi:hypothetical protein